MPDSQVPRIGVIISSTRETRFGDKPARWIFNIASTRDDMQVELLDLRDFNLPFFNERASNAWAPSQSAEAVHWQQTLARLDGFIVITAEYNRSITGALKNALDQAYTEWIHKPMACVGYGATGASRAIEHLRLIAVELQMAPTRTGVHILGGDFYEVVRGNKTLDDLAYLAPNVKNMLDELSWWARTLKGAREAA